MIKLLICDGDGTLLMPKPSEDILHLLKRIGELNIGLAVATNSSSSNIKKKFITIGLPEPLIIATPEEVRARKPSPKFIQYISQQTGVKTNDMIFLGDDDKTDILCAINASVLPFASHYSLSGKPEYGLPVESPVAFMKYLETYGMQEAPFFGWETKDPSQLIEVYAVIGDHGSMGLTKTLRSLLKDKQDVYIGPKKNLFGGILFHYFLSQSYLSGLLQGIDYISVYPGHAANSQNQILAQYSSILQKLFHNRYLPDLLIRHTGASPSHATSGANRDIFQRLSTILVNDKYKKRLPGKRILILDDFTTSGNSLETARVMLLKAGAESVVGLAFAKYRSTYNVVQSDQEWDPFIPFALKPNQLRIEARPGILNSKADDFFSNVIWKAAQT
jgi:hypothetical protein